MHDQVILGPKASSLFSRALRILDSPSTIMLLEAIQSFSKATLAPTATTEKTLLDRTSNMPHAPAQSRWEMSKMPDAPAQSRWVKTSTGWVEVGATLNEDGTRRPAPLQGLPHEVHGQCYGFEGERNKWMPPRCTFASEHAARPGYDTLDASEYLDEPDVLSAKVAHLARLFTSAQCPVVYAGAGLSTSAGINDYASRGGAGSTIAAGPELRSPMCAQPTLAHRVLVGLHQAGRLHRLIQQNHDGLPRTPRLSSLDPAPWPELAR